MKGDFTRDTFNPTRHFSRVLMQQGRVQLDADWNELQAIVLHHLRTLAKDIFGDHGGPHSAQHGLGFEIALNNDQTDLTISPGHYYVQGILCENEGQPDESGGLGPVSYTDQPHYPMTDEEKKDRSWAAGYWLVYLDVWERHVSYIEDDDIREKALAGPDTATRAQVVWQVKLMPVSSTGDPCSDSLPEARPDGRARLRARVKPGETSKDPCITPPGSKYRGENQLYRVEIHRGNEDGQQATFKWSRDNGSVVARWMGNDGDAILVSSARGFTADQWIELTDDVRELRGEPGEMRKILRVDGESLVVEAALAWSSALQNAKVRRWDQTATEKQELRYGAIPVVEKTPTQENWLEIENGIEIQFDLLSNARLRTGDYWLIPGRAETGTIEWPLEKVAGQPDHPSALPPHGVHHDYAPLATLNAGEVTNDCRCRIEVRRLCEPAITRAYPGSESRG